LVGALIIGLAVAAYLVAGWVGVAIWLLGVLFGYGIVPVRKGFHETYEGGSGDRTREHQSELERLAHASAQRPRRPR